MKYYLCVQCPDRNGDIKTFIRDENKQQVSDSYQDLYELFNTPYWRNNWMIPPGSSWEVVKIS